MTRTLPHSLEAEASVLGGILLRNEMLARLDTLEIEDFYSPKHQALFAAMRNLEAASMPIDVTTVIDELTRVGKLDAVGVALIGEVAMAVPSPDRVDAYAAIMVRHRVTRETIRAASEIVDALYTDHGDIDEYQGEAALQWAQSKLSRVESRSDSTASSIGKIVAERMVQLHRIAEAREMGRPMLTGLPTSIAELDRILGGLQLEILTLIGARPGMGKSSVLMGIVDACTEAGIGVHSFVLEDSRASYADRAIARLSGVPGKKLQQVNLLRGDFEAIQRATSTLKRRQGWILEDRATLTAEEIVRAARRRAAENKTKAVIVDYMQLVKKRDWRMSDNEHLDDAATTFMRAAKDDGFAYIAASQLNRDCEKRPNKRPQMSDLRASGALEERPKCIVFLYRGAEYGDAVKGIDYGAGDDEDENYPSDWERRIEYLVEKNSNGETGRVLGTWDGPTMRAA